ncbi:ABC transporter ATP-binding protein [Microbacterium sp. LWO13-1.2]|uniref:ABC transporter ATP-binding protein n=1 Tax=Microbacterium sp. LWO13-1.2 TaxID=3135262 RepID=UPI0031390763
MTDVLSRPVLPLSDADAQPVAQGTPLLSVRDLTVTFHGGRVPVRAVRGVSFDIRAGESVAIVGESGSGKSVTARALLGVAGAGAAVNAERLSWADADLRRFTERQWRGIRGRRIGLVLQDALSSLDPLRRIGAEVAEPLAVHRLLTRGQHRFRVRELLTSVGIPRPDVRARQYPHELSGGLRQRALIASALAGAPELIVADEPTTALDVTVQAQILDLLADLRSRGTALLVISHDLAVVAQIADRVLVMRDGVVVEEGPTRRVLTAPRHEYTRQLLDAVPGSGSRGRRLSDDRERVGQDDATPAVVGSAPVVVRADRLRKTYRAPGGEDTVALEEVSFALHRSEIVGIVGESGSGKSTAARVVLGLAEPDSGSVEFLGEAWSGIPEQKRRMRRPRIQHISQDPLGSFDPRQRVGAIIAEALARVGVPRAERPDEVGRLLESVGLTADVTGRRPSSLSGGQRQRVAIARALATRPEVIVCDEAVSALDVSVQAQVLDLLVELRDRTGVALLFISHDLGVIHHIADRVLVMKDGRVVEQGDVHEVFTAPRHPYTQQLLASLPTLPPREATPERILDAQD